MLAFSSVIGIIINTIFTTYIKRYLIKVAAFFLFFYGGIHLVFFVGLTMMVERPHKGVYYVFEVLNGVSRVTFIPIGIVILKIHKDKVTKQQ